MTIISASNVEPTARRYFTILIAPRSEKYGDELQEDSDVCGLIIQILWTINAVKISQHHKTC